MSETHAFRHATRVRRTEQRLARIFLDRGGLCHICTRKLRPGDKYQFDHITALEAGGTDDDTNIAPACDWCHKGKTRKDHGTAAKIRAAAVFHVIPSNLRQKKGPPMPGTKRSGWKKPFYGPAVRRET